jgi:hypothetical protein
VADSRGLSPFTGSVGRVLALRTVPLDVRVERSGPAVLWALRDVAPEDADLFASEYRGALNRATASFDLSDSEEVLNRWWGIAYLRLNPPTDEEREIVRRLNAGEDVGWSSPEERLAAQGR